MEKLKPIIEKMSSIEYVKTPLGLAVAFLILFILGISYIVTMQKQRSTISRVLHVIITVIIVIIIVITVFMLERPSCKKELTIAKGSDIVIINNRVKIKLVEITTLATQEKHCIRKQLPDALILLERIFIEAGLYNAGEKAEKVMAMNQEQWDEFIGNLPPETALKIKYTPIVQFFIYIDNIISTRYLDQLFVKNDIVEIKKCGKPDEKVAKFEITHVYDTRDFASGERESVTIKILD